MRKLKWSDWAIHPGTPALDRAASSGLGHEQQMQGKGRVISLPPQPASSWQSALTSGPHSLSVPEKELWKIILENTKNREKIQSKFIKEIYYCKAQEHSQHTDMLRKKGGKLKNKWTVKSATNTQSRSKRGLSSEAISLTWCREVENLHDKGKSNFENVKKTLGQS